MKKIAIAAITATSVLALSACSSGDNDVIAKTDAGNVTKGELYTNMKNRGRKCADTARTRKSISKKIQSNG